MGSKDNLVLPNGLTMHEETNRVVWADARTEVGYSRGVGV